MSSSTVSNLVNSEQDKIMTLQKEVADLKSVQEAFERKRREKKRKRQGTKSSSKIIVDLT